MADPWWLMESYTWPFSSLIKLSSIFKYFQWKMWETLLRKSKFSQCPFRYMYTMDAGCYTQLNVKHTIMQALLLPVGCICLASYMYLNVVNDWSLFRDRRLVVVSEGNMLSVHFLPAVSALAALRLPWHVCYVHHSHFILVLLHVILLVHAFC